jgi:hypothetical protein
MHSISKVWKHSYPANSVLASTDSGFCIQESHLLRHRRMARGLARNRCFIASGITTQEMLTAQRCGCHLAENLGIELRRVGSGKRLTFSSGEAKLSNWMEENARVVWHVCDEPWKIEEELISSLDLPLNLDQNRHHGFHPTLSRIRHEAKARARQLPILER